MSFPGKRLGLAGLTAVVAVSLSAVIGSGATAGTGKADANACRSLTPTVPGLTGTNGHDVIVGTNGNDEIDAKGGNDRVCAKNGDDQILGGNGNDTIRANAGQDFVDGEDGDDQISGNAGSDGGFVICKGPCTKGKNPQGLYGGPGEDRVGGGAGNDYVNGEEDNDVDKGAQDFDFCPDKQGTNKYISCEGPF
jgi:Ca2+-binding RTX toxin-like protein